MATFVLSFRAEEKKTYYEQYLGQFGPNVFAVMLAAIPDMPGEFHQEGLSLTVLCACRYKSKAAKNPNKALWGWVHLDPETKEEIGRDLEKAEAEINRWYYLELSY